MKNTGKRRIGLRAVIIASLALVAVVAAVYAATTIDSFTYPVGGGGTYASMSSTQNSNVYIDASILGGYRHVTAKWLSGTSSDNDTVKIFINDTEGKIAFSSDDSTVGTGEVRWNGSNSPTAYALPDDALTAAGNTGFRLRVLSADIATSLTIYGYTDAANYASFTQYVRPGIVAGALDVEYFIPFSAFTENGSFDNDTDWSTVRALVVTFNDISRAEAQDFSIVLFQSSEEVREYGDLPLNKYGAAVLGAYHQQPSSVRLGSKLDLESSYQTTAGASGDDVAVVDDEDGIFYIQQFGNQYQMHITISGCPNLYCQVNGWIDLNQDGSFGGPGEQIYDINLFGTGNNNNLSSTPFQIDSANTLHYYFVRLRVCQQGSVCNSPTGNSATGEVEDHRLWLDPTAVELAAFSAAWNVSEVQVDWVTTLEVDTAGFNVWRSETEDGKYVQANDSLIPTAAPGSTSGGTYTFTDSGVVPGTTYFYKLEEIETGAVHNWYGPVEAAASTPSQVTLSGLTGRGASLSLAALALLIGSTGGFVLLRRRR